jgi:hypothetical protein
MTTALHRPVGPEPRRLWRHQVAVVAVILAALTAGLAPCLGAAVASHRQLSREEAEALAKRIAGYPEAETIRAEQRLVDGSAFPFGRPRKWLVWEITLKMSLISGSEHEGYGPNPYINGMKVLLEADTGRLVRIRSVPFDPESLSRLAGRVPEKTLSGIGASVIGLSPPPKLTFAGAVKESFPSVMPKAKSVTAYLVTLSVPADSGPPRRGSCWVILAGGFHAHIRPDRPSTELMNVIPAMGEDFLNLVWHLPQSLSQGGER